MKQITLIALFLLAGMPVFSEESKRPEKENFSIKVEDKKNYWMAILQLGSLQIKTGSKAGFFSMSIGGKELCSFRTYHGNDETGKGIVPGLYAYSIKDFVDKENVKSVEIVSSLFKNKGVVQELRVKLIIRRNFPGVLVKSAVINLSDEKSDCYYCWLMPMPSDKYVNSTGEYNPPAIWKKVEFKDWIYLPGSGKKQGVAIVMDNSLPGIKFFTNQKHKGVKGSWGILRGGLWFNKNEENHIDFIVFPATSDEEVKREYKKVKKDKTFPEFKLKNTKRNKE